jgi:ABC-2 type transport system permease protein
MLRENIHTFRVAAWLGWQLESNWADPLVFLIFSVLRPLASALILVVMFQVIAGGQRGGFFEYMYLSNAFFMVVISALSGMSWAVMEDRENYRMLKYIYTSPARKLAYLSGRATAKLGIGILTALILLTSGALFLGLPLDLARVQWGWLVAYFVTGMALLLALGLVMAGVALVVARHGGSIGEVVGGCLLLFSGAYFPVDILPSVLREISLIMPVTYWLEGMRRAIAGRVVTISEEGIAPSLQGRPVSPLLASIDNWQLLGVLAVTALVCAIIAYFFYNWVEHEAKERGMIDRITGY